MFASNSSQVSSDAIYVENVFSTYLYTGNGASLPISNGIQLGGLPANGTVTQLTGDALTDSAPVPCGITSSGVSVSTSVKKYGTGSYAYSGASTSNLIATSPDLAVGTGDFTVECWVYATSALNQGVFQLGSDFTGAGNNIGLAMFPANQFQWGWDASYTGGVGSWPLNTWVYVAIVRQAGVMKLYVNGVKTGADNTYAGNINFGRCWVGNYYDGNQGFNGYIDDFRITNKALYTSNFTPPSQALPLDTLVAGSNYGGMVWIKSRSGVTDNALYDTVRGVTKELMSNTTAVQTTQSTGLNCFASTGFATGSRNNLNTNNATYVSWAFRKQPKFFDVVTYTGTGVAQNIAHSLGSNVGCLIVKRLDVTDSWTVWHRGINSGSGASFINLDLTSAYSNSATRWNNTAPTSTQFTVGTHASVNASGGSYVAYLFAHNAGGFGTAGTDNVISCGSYTGNNATVTVDLGWEPQWVLIKRASGGSGAWVILDNMRGVGPIDSTNTTVANVLYPNTSGAEVNAGSSNFGISATGFSVGSGWGDGNAAIGSDYIYIAIRRGPMKTPTSGTSVYTGVARSGTSAAATITTGFSPDVALFCNREATASSQKRIVDKLRGNSAYLLTQYTNAEATDTNQITAFLNTGVSIGNDSLEWNLNRTGYNYINWFFARAPGFMDEVCFTLPYFSTGSFNHNLGVAPEMMLVKTRNGVGNWYVYHKDLGTNAVLYLAANYAVDTSQNYWSSAPTTTQFSVNNGVLWGSANTAVAYLFASCPGVSKVGSYTGNGTSQTINCSFTSGARFVMIKRTDSTGNWYVWDTARGIVSANDPHLELNQAAAETTTNDSIDPDSTGFIVNQVAATNINVSSATYIYLAIA